MDTELPTPASATAPAKDGFGRFRVSAACCGSVSEVKITRASRDGGVDAVVFDTDPLRGGKIVIQAKRYTNTVGVSAVRDLYGTVVNEGANKGILVTTVDYGPDAYEFAKDKPLTLLSGSNLLHLLAKHGHQHESIFEKPNRYSRTRKNDRRRVTKVCGARMVHPVCPAPLIFCYTPLF